MNNRELPKVSIIRGIRVKDKKNEPNDYRRSQVNHTDSSTCVAVHAGDIANSTSGTIASAHPETGTSKKSHQQKYTSIETPMSEFATDLLNAVSQLANKQSLPLVRQFELPPQLPTAAGKNNAKKNNFAALVLEDGSVGMTYVALDHALGDLRQNPILDSIEGKNPMEIASLYQAEAGWQRALGLSAINAISQHLLQDKNILQPMTDTLPVLFATDENDNKRDVKTEDHFGMVGYFGRLVEPLTAMGARITVIELDAELVRSDNRLEVTLDTSKLKDCNKVIITGTTLLNHTIENILQHCTNAQQIMMFGPTASCLPQPLFDRGVTLVGGFHVSDTTGFIEHWQQGSSWRQCGFRYSICASQQ